ncbi:hypothetical protein L596_009164 [Steinernema carpocapsae]|uniref:Uncharacterized protein n=1 Tax=Steinernema carpocapsae TaxID=34508 RepID=A0A4U5PER7_STECR|nr:hypothetical protein L596_009164 [Steinernema carpocapsae]
MCRSNPDLAIPIWAKRTTTKSPTNGTAASSPRPMDSRSSGFSSSRIRFISSAPLRIAPRLCWSGKSRIKESWCRSITLRLIRT